jgi:hypothetical protein
LNLRALVLHSTARRRRALVAIHEGIVLGEALAWRSMTRTLLQAGLISAVGLVALPARSHQQPGMRLARVPPAHELSRGAGTGLSALPFSAWGPVSEALGAVGTTYRLTATFGRAFVTANPAQHMRMRFSRSGVQIDAGGAHVRLRVSAISYGASLIPLGTVAPRADGNRVAYNHAGLLDEWYANGPLGLEQGFTVPRGPAVPSAGLLTLSLGLLGDVLPVLARNGKSIELMRAGIVVMRYGGLAATDARKRPLPSWLEVHGRQLLLRVDARHARYPLEIDPFVQQGAKLVGAGRNGGRFFGESVALSANGDVALVGGGEDNGYTGGAWMFTRSGETWTLQSENLTSAGAAGSGFGTDVALSANGDTALISGPYDNNGAGAVWVFTRVGEVWLQQGETLVGEGGVAEGFGGSIALSADGDTALIGARDTSTGEGVVWTFERTGETWHRESETLPGGSVALSADGQTALIGDALENTREGAAWVFTRADGAWAQQSSQLVPDQESGANPEFGAAVALSADGSTALIGAPYDGSGGAAWVFTRSGETWTQQSGELMGGEDARNGSFGWSVALSGYGTTALVGGYFYRGGVGAALAFTRSGEVWSQDGAKLLGGEEDGEALFAKSVALSANGGTAIIGGEDDDGSVGAAWVFVGFAVPGVVTGGASGVSWNAAVLNGVVSLNGLPGVAYFQYGTSVGYGQSTAPESIGSGGGAVAASVGALSPGTTYHFRVVGESAAGTTYGADQTFTAAAVPAVVQGPGLVSGGPAVVAPVVPQVLSTMVWSFAWTRRYTVVKRLVVRGVPVGSRVEVSCRGRGCPFARDRVCPGRAVCKGARHSTSSEVSLTSLFKGRRLGVGVRITVSIVKSGWIGRSFLFTTRTNQGPSQSIACLAPGSSQPGRGC